jgi:hypothetical protein
LSVVVPTHDEEAALPELIRRTEAALAETGRTWELLIVDDGSIDRTWQVIAEAASADRRVRGIRLSRNFGHQAALSAGMDHAAGDAVITMDGDLQHPPEAIPLLVSKAAEGYEVVYAVRSEEDTEGWLKVATASVFYRLLNWTRREALLAGAGYVVLTVLVYARMVAGAGVLHDDWTFIEHYSTFAIHGPVGTAFAAVGTNGGDRPVGFFILGFLYRALGAHQAEYIVMLAIVALAVAWLLWRVLREVGCPSAPAFAIGGLSMLIPVSDAVRFWPAAASADIALALILAGLLAALTGTRKVGAASVLWHAGALVLYLASMLVYEAGITLVPLLFLVYRARTAWVQAIRRGAADWVAAGLVIIWSSAHTTKSKDSSSGVMDRVHQIIDEGGQIYASMGTSLGFRTGQLRVALSFVHLVELATVAVIVLAVVRMVRLPQGDALRGLLGRWLWLAAAGLVTVGAGHATLFAISGYSPLGAGIDNRVNVVAAVGYVLLTYSVLMLAALAVSVRRFPTWWPVLAAVGIAVVMAGIYGRRLNEDESTYIDAHTEQQAVLATFRGAVSAPPRGTTVVSFQTPRDAGFGVPVFGATWDLSGALRTMWRDPTVVGWPQGTLTALRCRSSDVLPVGPLYSAASAVVYGHLLFVDARSGRSQSIRDARACSAWVGRWTPEPA